MPAYNKSEHYFELRNRSVIKLKAHNKCQYNLELRERYVMLEAHNIIYQQQLRA